MSLLERAALVSRLEASLAAGGSMIFVGGEAGIGKSSLIRAFRDRVPAGTAVRIGWCDALGAPRPLGPLHDLADGRLADLLAEHADRHTIFSELVARLSAGPSVLIVEDAHWADEATLDLLLFLGRRVAGLPATVLVTHRDDETGRDHPLRRVLGDLATVRSVGRLTVPRLSPEAVAELARDSGADAAQLHEITGGNPFFVTEALASGAAVPPTVRDAVLARVARLGPAARDVLDVVAVVPDGADLGLVNAVVGEPAALDVCVGAGVLVAAGGAVRFRHELARRAVEAELPPARAAGLNARVLGYLAGWPTDPARLAHHAEAAGDGPAVLEHATRAARAATVLGAHREAAAQYARALRFAGALPAADRAALHELRAEACDRSGRVADALAASAAAVELHPADSDLHARALARRSLLLWSAGRGGGRTSWPAGRSPGWTGTRARPWPRP